MDHDVDVDLPLMNMFGLQSAHMRSGFERVHHSPAARSWWDRWHWGTKGGQVDNLLGVERISFDTTKITILVVYPSRSGDSPLPINLPDDAGARPQVLPHLSQDSFGPGRDNNNFTWNAWWISRSKWSVRSILQDAPNIHKYTIVERISWNIQPTSLFWPHQDMQKMVRQVAEGWPWRLRQSQSEVPPGTRVASCLRPPGGSLVANNVEKKCETNQWCKHFDLH